MYKNIVMVLLVVGLGIFYPLLGEENKVTSEIFGGLNLATFVGDVDQNSSYLPHWFWGIRFDIPISQSLSIQSEIMLSKQGILYQKEILNKKVDHVVALPYLEVPILFKWKHNYSFLQYHILGGPVIGFRNEGQSSMQYKSIKVVYSTDNYDSANLAVSIGAGFTFKKVDFDLRYNRGILDINEDNNIHQYTSNFMISLGLIL